MQVSMFNARKFNSLPPALAAGTDSCGSRLLWEEVSDMAHVTISFPIDRGVTR